MATVDCTSTCTPLLLGSQQVDSERIGDEQSEHMLAILLSIFRFTRLLLSSHQDIAIENAALRLQLAAFQRKRKRPGLHHHYERVAA
jgi:hypothetical protein